MSAATLLFSASISLAIGVVYLVVGTAIARRHVSASSREALLAFAVWWWGLGAASLTGAVPAVLAAAGITSLTFSIFLTFILLWVLCLALAGLLNYLVFLFLGSRRALMPILVAYAGLYLYLLWLVIGAGPNGVEVTRWAATLTYETEFADGVGLLLLVLLVAPALVGAVGYLILGIRLPASPAKLRAIAVPSVIIAMFGSSIVASITRLTENETWQFVSRFIGLAAALVILALYRQRGGTGDETRAGGSGARPAEPASASAPVSPP